MAHARRRADRLAEAAGRAVGRVLSIKTDVSRDPSPRLLAGGIEEMRAAMPVEPPDMTVATSVTVEFALED